MQIYRLVIKLLTVDRTCVDDALAQTYSLHVEQTWLDAQCDPLAACINAYIQTALVLDIVCAVACSYEAE